MKRIWVSVCAMVLMITLCIIELNFTNSSIQQLTDTLDKAEASVRSSDYDTAFRLSREASQAWEMNHRVLSFYTTHDALEQIDLTFAVLTAHLENGNYKDFLMEKSRVTAQLENVKENEAVNFHNIL